MTQGADEAPQRFKVIHPPGVHVQEHPDQKSLRLCLLGHGEVIDTFAWDRSQSYRQVRVQNAVGQIMEGWVQVRSEASGILLEREAPVAPAPAPAMKQEMDIETVMEMKRQLEEKLRELQGQAAAAPQAEGASPSPRQDQAAAANALALAPGQEAANSRASRFAAYAQDCGVAIGHGGAVQIDESAELPTKSSVGQLYQVVHSPKVAVRQLPSLNSPCIRSIFHGMRVELFEWDNTRQWRRVPVDRAIEPTEVLMDGDQLREGTVRTDGWVLIEHPTYGPLMQAVSKYAVEEETANAASAVLLDFFESKGWPRSKTDGQEPDEQDPRYEQAFGSPREAAFVPEGEGQVWAEGGAARPEDGAAAQDFPAQEGEGDQNAEALLPTGEAGQALPPEPEGPQPLTMEDRINAWEECWSPGPIAYYAFVPPKPDKEAQRKDLVRRAELAHEEEVLASVDERPGLKEPRLMRAVRAGNYEVVRKMLCRCPDVHECDTLGETALFEATVSARCDMVAVLLLCKANPSKKSKEGLTPMQLCTDKTTLALLNKWEGVDADRRHLLGALQLVHESDRRRLCELFGLSEQQVAAFLERPPDKPPEKPPESADRLPAIKGASQEQQGSPSPRGDATPSPRAAAPGLEGAASPGAAATDVAFPEPDDVPERTEVGKLFQVIYKMVAVRRHPDTKAESIRAMKKGTKVTMYEFDRTRMWRRVRVEAPKSDEAGADAELIEVDGWMLLRSEKVGLLLQEIQEEEDEEEEDDDAAG